MNYNKERQVKPTKSGKMPKRYDNLQCVIAILEVFTQLSKKAGTDKDGKPNTIARDDVLKGFKELGVPLSSARGTSKDGMPHAELSAVSCNSARDYAIRNAYRFKFNTTINIWGSDTYKEANKEEVAKWSAMSKELEAHLQAKLSEVEVPKAPSKTPPTIGGFNKEELGKMDDLWD
jgi:hypothetical protein